MYIETDSITFIEDNATDTLLNYINDLMSNGKFDEYNRIGNITSKTIKVKIEIIDNSTLM